MNDNRGRTHYGCADQHRLCRSLERIARAVIGFQPVLCGFKVHIEAEVLLQLRFNAGNIFNQRQLVDRLSIVGNRAIRVDSNRDRPHAKEAKRDQSKRKDRRSQHQRRVIEAPVLSVIARPHQRHHAQPQPVGRKIAGHKSRQNPQRSSTLLRRRDNLLHMGRFGRRVKDAPSPAQE